MNFHLCSADCIRHCEHDNSLFIVVAIVDRAAFVLQVFHCTSSSDSDDNQFQVVVYLLVLYNYLIYNYYYTHTHTHMYTRRESGSVAAKCSCTVGSQWLVQPHCIHFRVISNGARNPTRLSLAHALSRASRSPARPTSPTLIPPALSSPFTFLPLPPSLSLYLPNNCMRFDGLK